MRRGAALIASAMLIALLAAGQAMAAMVSPPSKDFGNQNVGTSSSPATFVLSTSASQCINFPTCSIFQLSNVDTSALGGGPGSTTTSGDFVIHNQNCSNPETSPFATLAFSTCEFDVSFLPTAGGPASKTLSFPDDHGPTATLSLAGIGIAPSPPPASSSTPMPTSKKCKHKHHHASAAKKCKKKRR